MSLSWMVMTVNDQAEPRLLRKLEPMLRPRAAPQRADHRRKKICAQVVAAIRRKGEVAGLVRGLESAAQQICGRFGMGCVQGMTEFRRPGRRGPRKRVSPRCSTSS